MLQKVRPSDYIICSGESHSLEEFVETAFDLAGLDWRQHVTRNKSLLRPSEISISRGNSDKAKAELGWRAKSVMRDVIRKMADAEAQS